MNKVATVGAADRRVERALITGIAGSGGSYLAEYLVRHHPEVETHGISRWHSTTAQNNLRGIADDITVHEADLSDMGSVLEALEASRPDVIFHLAAHANVRASFTTVNAVLSNNILGTSTLLEGIRRVAPHAIVHVCSSSEVYGQVRPEDTPIREDCPMRPVSPYAVSKVAQDLLGFSYFVSYGMRTIRTRMFTYLNPRRADLFATSFARQVALIERGLQDELVHGNLDSVRTFLDVRDAMRAYWLATLHCEYGEAYNIGGVTTMTVGEVLERLKSLCDVPIPTRVDPALLRPADVTLQVPCVDAFVEATGWQPEYAFDESLEDLLNHWRQRADIEAARLSAEGGRE